MRVATIRDHGSLRSTNPEGENLDLGRRAHDGVPRQLRVPSA